MKTKLLKQNTINVAAVAFVSLLAACATTSSPQLTTAHLTIQEKRSSSPVVAERNADNGNQLTAREVWGWESLAD
jgi:hypothetical protein